MRRVVAWFSHGVCSAVATRMALQLFGDACVVVNIDTGSEHPDNERFMADCERWFGRSVEVLKSERYTDIYDVFDQTGYLVGPGGARCTIELKKVVRHRFERPDDLHVFGYAADKNDAARAERFVTQNPGVDTWFPLLEHDITKQACRDAVEQAGIELPAMYKLGYDNNNCIGCVKGGQWYWNKIRVDFPEVFERMSAQEVKMGRTILRRNNEPLPLSELDPAAGRHHAEPMECSLDCQTALVELHE